MARREWDDPDVPGYESLAVFASEMAKNNAPRGIMVETSAAIRCGYADGRVFCMSPHPEMTAGLDNMLPAAVRWLVVQKCDPKPKIDQ